MNLISIVLLLAVAAGFFFAVRTARRGGSCGECRKCRCDCCKSGKKKIK
ncbi:MAG: hypothetical protein J6B57_09575 [Oscillospiraceae bacterium]|nr:hypothetical protein [Oscillospiraceae bacterium]